MGRTPRSRELNGSTFSILLHPFGDPARFCHSSICSGGRSRDRMNTKDRIQCNWLMWENLLTQSIAVRMPVWYTVSTSKFYDFNSKFHRKWVNRYLQIVFSLFNKYIKSPCQNIVSTVGMGDVSNPQNRIYPQNEGNGDQKTCLECWNGVNYMYPY